MSNRLVSREDIEAIREAAQTLDWNQTDLPFQRVVAELPPETLIALAEDVLRDGLPTFERNQPGETWPRRALDGLETELGPEYPGPGGGSFGWAVEDLLEARARVDEPEACRKLSTQAMHRAINAEMSAVWGIDHPDAWKRSYEAGMNGESLGCADPMWGWNEDPKVHRAYIIGWNNLADRLEALERPEEDDPATARPEHEP